MGFAVAMSIGTYYGLGKSSEDILQLRLDHTKATMWEIICHSICFVSFSRQHYGYNRQYYYKLTLKSHHYLHTPVLGDDLIFLCRI